MRSSPEFRPLSSDSDAAAYARILAHSFGRTETESAKWLQLHPRENIRILAADGAVVAGLILMPMGQFFGGRSVPMTGISAVGVAPEARGRGAATELMRRTVLELRDRGVAISGLYPATQKLYRATGYEQAGHRFEIRIALQRIGIKSAGAEVRPMTDSDRPQVHALYRRLAAEFDGNLDRNPVNWDRIERPPPTRTDPARAFVVEAAKSPGQIEGYIYLTQPQPATPAGGRHEVHVHDMGAATGAAARRLWSFLAGYATLATDMVWYAGPSHPMLALLDEQPYRLSFMHHWMLRIVDVGAALAARGYPAGLRGRLVLDVRDDLFEGNRGGWSLELDGGIAAAQRLEATGSADEGTRLRLNANALASLYSGFFQPAAMRSTGLLEGDDEAVRLASAMFAGGTPWMSDMF